MQQSKTLLHRTIFSEYNNERVYSFHVDDDSIAQVFCNDMSDDDDDDKNRMKHNDNDRVYAYADLEFNIIDNSTDKALYEFSNLTDDVMMPVLVSTTKSSSISFIEDDDDNDDLSLIHI